MPNDVPEGNQPNLLEVHPYYMEPDLHIDVHSHPFYELVFIQRGRLRIRINSAERIAQPGDILLYPPGVAHEEWAQDGEPVVTSACEFLWEGLEFTSPVFCHDAHERIQEWLAKLTLKFLLTPSEMRNLPLCLSLLNMIVQEIRQLVAHEHEAMVGQVRAHIRAHMKEAFTLDDLATISGLSKFHFVRQYRAVTGHTPMEDARFLRLQEARRLLIETTLPLYEIAPQVGIPDVCRLSRLLKTHLGTGARELRRSGRHRK